MKKYLDNDTECYVPRVISELSTERIFTSEFIRGVIINYTIMIII